MKATAPTLSEHLLIEARKFSVYPRRVRKAKTAAAFVEKTLRPFVIQLGIVAKGRALPLQQLLDEFYTKRVLEDVPSYVRRTKQLEPLEVGASVPRQVNLYVEQASWSFVLGQWDAAVALSRACVEEVAEDTVGRHVGKAAKRELQEWILEADRKRIWNSEQVKRAKAVQVLGNTVLHQRSATAEEAEQVVTAVRALVAQAYR